MRVRLLHPDRDFDWAWALGAAAARDAARGGRGHRPRNFDPGAGLPWNAADLVRDLGLDVLFGAMAGDDDLVSETTRRIVLTAGGNTAGTIRYRQEILRDCLRHPGVVRELYALAGEAAEQGRRHYLGTLARYPDYVLRSSIEMLEALLGSLVRLRRIADRHAGGFESTGWRTFFAIVRRDLDDAWIARVREHLEDLRFRNGIVFGARLGPGNRAVDHVLYHPPRRRGGWLARLVAALRSRFHAPSGPVRSFTLHPRDEAGFRILRELGNRGTALAADALGRSADHVRNFFAALQVELAFYVGCLELHARLSAGGEPVCLPVPAPAGSGEFSCRDLYDPCLFLATGRRVVGNDVDTDGRNPIVVTGANEGGKSTFLRSIGIAQLMMQAGMFVPATAFRSGLCDGLFTHWKREEDAGLGSGKLDEELARMSDIVDNLTAHPMILFNESFAATNEREGAEIAGQIVSALREKGVRMVFVTHLHEFARALHETDATGILFLRADRREDGSRTFRLIEGAPMPTGFGQDLYDRVFGSAGGSGTGPPSPAPAEPTPDSRLVP